MLHRGNTHASRGVLHSQDAERGREKLRKSGMATGEQTQCPATWAKREGKGKERVTAESAVPLGWYSPGESVCERWERVQPAAIVKVRWV